MKKFLNILKGLYKFFKIILTIIIILIVCVILIQKVFNNKISIGGYRIFTVVSPSMEPDYKVYDIIVSKKTETSNLKIGDDIVYLGKKGDFNNKIITHRIIDILNDENSYTITTQGIANTAPDPEINETQVYGKVILRSKILSFLSRILNSTIGFYCLILIPTSLLIIAEIFDKDKEKDVEE